MAASEPQLACRREPIKPSDCKHQQESTSHGADGGRHRAEKAVRNGPKECLRCRTPHLSHCSASPDSALALVCSPCIVPIAAIDAVLPSSAACVCHFRACRPESGTATEGKHQSADDEHAHTSTDGNHQSAADENTSTNKSIVQGACGSAEQSARNGPN